MYYKMHLVPFAESIPFANYFSALKKLNFGQANFKAGSKYTIFNVKYIPFANLICYESSIPKIVRKFVNLGAKFITIETNDSWCGHSSGVYQHFQIAKLRAVEMKHVNKLKKIGVLTSGGDAPGMNAAVRSVVRSAVYNNIDCYGIYKGFEGLISDDLVKLNARGVNNIINKGGTILKSARCLEFRTKEGRLKAKATLDKYDIDSLVVIGGNGSLNGALIFEEEHGIKTIGIPGTIDNDLVGTRCTLGYDTALNTAVNAIDKIFRKI